MNAKDKARELAHRAYFEIPQTSKRPVQDVLSEEIATAIEQAEAQGSTGLLKAAEYILDEWESGAGVRKAGFVALREQVRVLKRGGRE